MSSQAAPALEPLRETVSCRLCSAQCFTPYLDGRGYKIVCCDECGLFYVNPQPSSKELEQYYANYDRGNQWRTGEEPFNRRVREAILRFKQGGSVLDVGSGSGNLLRCLREAGFQVFGIEPSLEGSAYAQAEHKIGTFHGTVEAFMASDRKSEFDVVTVLNVLEHLKEPATTLRQLRELVRADGILVVVVPDARLHALLGETRRRLKIKDPFWMETERHPLVGFDPPHHLTSFEPRTLSMMVERCGFKPIYLKNAPVVFNDERWKNLAKIVLHACSETLYWMTVKQLVLGYSTQIVARKA
jgi:SAM-dependent methyltransferase